MTTPIHRVYLDGGGSKTALRYGTETLRWGPSALSLGVTPLMACRQEVRAHWNLPETVHWVMSMAGCEHLAHRNALLANWGEPLILMSDRDAGWLGASCGKPMAVLTVGTGTALAWMTSDHTFGHAGGLGFRLGDEGSGAWIGRYALALLARALDGDCRVDLSVAAWSEGLQVAPTLDSVMALAADATPALFARRAPWVMQAADAGDPVARGICADAVVALDHLLGRLPESLPIALVGGLSGIFGDPLRHLGHAIETPKGDVFDGLSRVVEGFECPGLQIWRCGYV